MGEGPIKDGARSDKSSSSYRMTSFLVLSAGKTQPVSESDLDQGGDGGPEAELHFPDAEATFSARADATVPPLMLLWQRITAFYDLLIYGITLPFVWLGYLLHQLGRHLRGFYLKLIDFILVRPLRLLNAGLSALTFRLLGLRWNPGGPAEPEHHELHDEEPLPALTAALPPVSFLELFAMNITFTDNHAFPIFDFTVSRRIRYSLSKAVVDPVAAQNSLAAIRECASRAVSIPAPAEGRYAGIPVAEVLSQVSETDLQWFLQYVKAFPGNYIGRNLKMSETFATWVVYGAPEP